MVFVLWVCIDGNMCGFMKVFVYLGIGVIFGFMMVGMGVGDVMIVVQMVMFGGLLYMVVCDVIIGYLIVLEGLNLLFVMLY